MNDSPTTHPISAPQLDAPGAGLPQLELLVARTMFRIQRMMKGRSYWDDLFETERTEILRLANSVPETTASQPILIDRIRGMEDSSRFWSVYMVLQHLNVVNASFTAAVLLLMKGRIPEKTVNIADVKPHPDSDVSTVSAFEKTCETFLKKTGKFADLRSSVRFQHPWFGPLDSAGWHALAAFHMRLHRKQIQKILDASAST